MRVMNRFIQLETSPVAGGADIRISARGDYFITKEIDANANEVVIHLRRDAGPRIGEGLMVGKRYVLVADRRFDGHGRLQVMDADSGGWYAVPDGKE